MLRKDKRILESGCSIRTIINYFCASGSATSASSEVNEGDPPDEAEDDAQEDSSTITGDASASNENVQINPAVHNSQCTFISDFESDPEMQSLSMGIYRMWRNQQLCDVLFIVNGDTESFYAHKLVLAASCGNIAKQANDNGVIEYHIPNVQGKSMKQALRFFYTGKIDITSENIEDLLEICGHISPHKLVNLCKDFLLDLTLASSVRHRIIAFKYGLEDVATSIDSYIRDHFTSLVNSEAFLQSDFEIIYDIISSDMLTTPNELQLFHACASWIKYAPAERLGYAVPLMNMVRFNNILPAKIVSQVEPVTFMTDIPGCKDMLYKAFRHHALFRDLINSVSKHTTRSPMSGRAAPRSTPCYRSPEGTPPYNTPEGIEESDRVLEQHESRKHSTIQTKPSGISKTKKYTFRDVIGTIQKEIRRQKQQTRELAKDNQRRASALPDHESQQQGRVSSTPSLTPRTHSTSHAKRFPSGGVQVLPQKMMSEPKVQTRSSKSQQNSSTHAVSSPVTEKLTRARSEPMRHDIITTSFESQTAISPILAGSSPFNNPQIPLPPRPPLIFAMGGMNPYFKDCETQQRNINQSIQQYLPGTNSWSVVTQMPQPLHHLAVTSVGDRVYVTGGQKSCTNSDELPTRDCFVYDVALGLWEPVASLKTARARHSAVTLNDVVYALGGIDCVGMSLKSMEYYEPDEDKWYFTQPMKDARVELAAVAHRGKILVVGGSFDVDDKLLLNTVEVYDPRTGNWNSKSRFPLHISGGSMVEVHGTVYFVGGYVMQDNNCLSVDSVFRYCDETDSWEGFQTVRVPRHNALVAAIGCKIYVIGGESSASLGHALTNVECIDVETNELVTGSAPLLSPAYGIGGCSLH